MRRTGSGAYRACRAVQTVIDGKGEAAMDVRVGDVLEMKKNHPCGTNRFEVLRIGMDFRLKCAGCGHEMMVPRVKIERNIRRIHREETPL